MKDIAKKLKRYEKRLSYRNYKEFQKMFLEFKEIIKKDNSNFTEFDRQLKIDFDKFNELLKKYLVETFIFNVKSVIKTYTRMFGWELSKNKISSITDVLIKHYNEKYSAKKVAKISETTRKIINNVITKSQSEGLDLKSTMNKIMESIDGMSQYRARTIARTETSSSINNTSLKTAKASGMKKKCWIHIGGRYTSRANHKRLNNKWIGIDEYYNLGNGIKTLCPHHPSLPASEIINCNCLIIFK